MTATPSWRSALAKGRRVFAFGGLLIGLSTFQAEFDFGVPQFNFILEPVMLAFAAGVALVGARLWIGRGGALGAVAFFIVIRGGLALLVGPVLGETTPHLPLYLAEAALVELAVLVVPARRPYAFGAFAGRADRHRRLRGRVRLVAHLDADRLAREPDRRRAPLRADHRRRRRPDRRLRRRRAHRRARARAPRRPDRECRASSRRRSGSPRSRRSSPSTSATSRSRASAASSRLRPPRPARSGPSTRRSGSIRRRDRRSALGQRDRMAGRPEARPRRARGGLARRLPHLRAAARVRELEDADPHPPGRRADRSADLHARGRGDPRRGRTGARRHGHDGRSSTRSRSSSAS